MSGLRLRVEGTRFKDQQNREVTLRGINIAGDCKLPAKPEQNSHTKEGFFDGDSVSFVGRPFSLEDAHIHFSRLRKWGMNTIRYLFTWEALEHAGPGKYDEEFIDFTIKMLRLAKEYGFYVFMDPHQDVWSRFTGGSGAPLWTLYACGLDPKKFKITQAALVQNTWDDPAEFPKMIWATNYYRLAAQTIFTLFFGGKDFAPKAIINGQNIQDFLQGHFINACKHLAKRIIDAGDVENSVVFGFESMNEPNPGYLCTPDLSIIPKEQSLKRGTSPTPFQALLTGSGRAVEMEKYEFGSLGPYKSGTELVDPQGQSCWISSIEYDTKYGFKRDPDWKLGECIWAQHGVWDPSNDELVKKDYFATHPLSGESMTHEFFTNSFFMHHWRNYSAAIRSVYPNSIMICQPSPFEVPPIIKDTRDDDPNMVYATHFYDGITLLTKKWNRYWNVDVLGLLRGKYLSPAFAIKLGENAIRNCFKDQLSRMKQEGLDNMGNHPCLFTEIGIPYDMDDKHAYDSGDYTSQTLAMDANCFALEGCGAAGYTMWVYTAQNNHKWGDNWNGEDLSLYSVDDKTLPLNQSPSTTSIDPSSPSYSESRSSEDGSISKKNLQKTLSVDEMSVSNSSSAAANEVPTFRAAEAYVRPSPIYTHGQLVSHVFDLRQCAFTMVLNTASATDQAAPTEIYLPQFHFPQQESEIEVSGGKWEISSDVVHGTPVQRLRWWHAEGEQKLTVKGIKRRQGRVIGPDEAEDSYLEQCRRNCSVM
ncbi:glycoside hydrolase family 5 protein [Myriangium duriaei CBS 260.36]|uniref:Glycoside hydrolase family 5 protein n=1 Tax=Myriangium duriaei CBS 260.36 TaxID=1168546 RepID=A0A9P4IW72_9PEZI|nr:glycoside hydrolase family 5 protein [Myriangium duriaei CBS 260.36]